MPHTQPGSKRRPASSSWLGAFDREAAHLRQVVPAAAGGDPAAWHQVRVSSRRLRAHVAIAAAALPSRLQRKLRRRLRRLTGRLGRIRELDVTLALVDQLGHRNPRLTPGFQRVKADVASERHDRFAKASATMRGQAMRKLERALARARERIREAKIDWREMAAAELDKRGKRLLARLDRASDGYEPDRLHQVRIAVKRYRYALEASSAAGQPAARTLAFLKQAQDTLGRMHDLQVLTEHLDGDVVDAGPHRAAIADVLAAEIDVEHARFLALRDQLKATVTRSASRRTPRRGARKRARTRTSAAHAA